MLFINCHTETQVDNAVPTTSFLLHFSDLLTVNANRSNFNARFLDK